MYFEIDRSNKPILHLEGQIQEVQRLRLHFLYVRNEKKDPTRFFNSTSPFHSDSLRSLLERPSRESPRWVESKLLTKSSNMRLRVCFCVLKGDGSFKMVVLGGVVCAVERVWVMMDDRLRDGGIVWDRSVWE